MDIICLLILQKTSKPEVMFDLHYDTVFASKMRTVLCTQCVCACVCVCVCVCVCEQSCNSGL